MTKSVDTSLVWCILLSSINLLESSNASSHCSFSNNPRYGDYADWSYGGVQNERKMMVKTVESWEVVKCLH